MPSTDLDPSEADLSVASLHLFEFIGADHSERCGIEHGLFLLDQVKDVGDDHRLHGDEFFLPAFLE